VRNRAVFLDRDGTINKPTIRKGRPFPPETLKDFQFLPGVREAIKIFRDLEYVPVVVTNQPDFARGKKSIDQINDLNNLVRNELGIKDIYMCLHDDADLCSCRKPREGLLLKAAIELQLDLDASVMVGDRWRDIQAGQRAGCKSFFIDNGYDEKRPQTPFHRVTSLLEVANFLRSVNDF
jgi:D-glycero-D-manno-heptose 1,7-bisphosphate phosphatase